MESRQNPYEREYRAFTGLIEGKPIKIGDLVVLGLKSLFGILEMLVRYVPGGLGYKLRYYFYKPLLKRMGTQVMIDTGVFLNGCKNISLGDYVWVDANCRIEAMLGEISIGKRVHVAPFSILAEREPIIIVRCHEAIAEVTGIAPVGFRAPGYYLDKHILNVLLANGYLYDSSVLPSPVTCLMSLYIRLKTGRVPNKAFGRKRWTIASRHPTLFVDPECSQSCLCELPIATLPFVRFPLHTTFVFMFGWRYLKLASRALKRTSSFVYLLHAIDTFADVFGNPRLAEAIVPFRKSLCERLKILEAILGWLAGSGQPFGTNRELLATVSSSKLPQSRILRSLYYWN